MYQSGYARGVSWKAVAKPTVRQQRGKWVVRVDGIDSATGARLPRQLGTFASQRAARTAAAGFTADGVTSPSKGTVAWLVDRWIAGKVEIGAKTRAQYEWAAGHIKAGLGGLSLDQVDRDDVAAWLESLASGGQLSRQSIVACRMVLRAAMADAVDEGLMRRSPAARVAVPKLVVKGGLQREQPAWGEEEITRFIAAADDHRWAAGLRLAVLYGLRRSELIALRWDDIDLDAGTVRIDEGLIEVRGVATWTEGKSARSRRLIPMDSTMRKHFRARRAAQLREQAAAASWEANDLVFTTFSGACVQPRFFDRELERVIVAAGVPRLTSHGLRHTAATHMVRQATDLGELRAVADILGHSPEMLLRVYAHTLPESLRAVSERVGRRARSYEQ